MDEGEKAGAISRLSRGITQAVVEAVAEGVPRAVVKAALRAALDLLKHEHDEDDD